MGRFGLNSSHTYHRHRSAAPRVSIEITYNGPLTRYAKLRVAHAPGMPGMFSPPPTSKETASKRSRHASLTHSGGENVSGIPGACATRNFTYLARGPFLALARLLYIDFRLRHFTNILCHLKQKCQNTISIQTAYSDEWYFYIQFHYRFQQTYTEIREIEWSVLIQFAINHKSSQSLKRWRPLECYFERKNAIKSIFYITE